MAQLMMQAKIKECKFPEFYDDITYRRFNGTPEDIDTWVDICRNGLGSETDGREKYDNCMLGRRGYKPSDTFFVLKDGCPVATVTAVVYEDDKMGYLHMVGSKPECRGLGIGNYMNEIANAEFYSRGCEAAYLTTDEFRVPAIKSYLKAGYLPVEYDTGMKERWEAWLSEHGYSDIDFIDEDGNKVDTLLPTE